MQLDADFISKVLVSVDMMNGSFGPDVSFGVDSRTLKKGEIFVALRGEHVDGHDFISQALQKGASGFLLSQDRKQQILDLYGDELTQKQILFVPDTLQALIDLAKNWRDQFEYPVVAITGSVGKTTTKEMVRNITKLTGDRYLVSQGNQNTLIGVSLNILNMRDIHKAAIFEVGISERGIMKQIASLLKPTFSLITKVGYSHMEGLGDVVDVATEKRAIFSYFSERDIGVINGDQLELSKISYPHPVIKFGCKTTNQIQARKVVLANNNISFVVKIYKDKYAVHLPGCHEGRVTTALAAITVGYLLKIPNEILVEGIQQPVQVPGRFQFLQHPSGATIIHDGYNSNPDSVKASLLAFDAYQTKQEKIAILGDMLELGMDSLFWHRQLGRFLQKVTGLSQVILVGKHIQVTAKTVPFRVKATVFETAQEALPFVQEILGKDNIFLVKGSNSVKLGELVDRLMQPIKK